MDADRISFALSNLAAAARGQGDHPYDHTAALFDANITERGDDLSPLAMAWCAGLPEGCPTLNHYEVRYAPTGADMGKVYMRALIALERARNEGRKG